MNGVRIEAVAPPVCKLKVAAAGEENASGTAAINVVAERLIRGSDVPLICSAASSPNPAPVTTNVSPGDNPTPRWLAALSTASMRGAACGPIVVRTTNACEVFGTKTLMG